MTTKVIKNGIIVTPVHQYKGDILIEDEIVKAIGKKGEFAAVKAEFIDADGLYVIPGAVDEHTHMSMPSPDTYSMPWETETIAAAVGGTTTIVDFAIQEKGKTLTEAIDTWKKNANNNTAIDYSLHIAITDLNEDIIAEIPSAVEQGVTTFKLFMAYKDDKMVDDATLYRVLKQSKEVGGLVMVHAENGDVISILQDEYVKSGKTEPFYHAITRPIEIEAEATRRAIALANITDAPIFIVHVSGEEPAEEIRKARMNGQAVFGETCPHYLFLDDSYLQLPGFEGAKYVCSPPLREKTHQQKLWNAIADGTLQTIGTDHCSFNYKEQKHRGIDDFSKIPNGGNGIENWLQMLYSYGVKKENMTIEKLVELTATNPAKFMGLFPKKGTISVGSDADIVLFDPNKKHTIKAETQLQGSDYNFYEGFTIEGSAQHVFLRGEHIVKDDKYIGHLGQGQFIESKPYGAAYDSIRTNDKGVV
ncbi:dihydropyrimidinase [Gracilibacillus massiliensis]|uniref:dihydropyrimidinase n=1 Tax=Gracilibacillus massiliensis TaxID=1564956 RepID=UPI00071C45C0|nr:dihydropyrimidinase [Gracilibacillus massiliensis]